MCSEAQESESQSQLPLRVKAAPSVYCKLTWIWVTYRLYTATNYDLFRLATTLHLEWTLFVCLLSPHNIHLGFQQLTLTWTRLMLSKIDDSYGNVKQRQNQPTHNNTGVWGEFCRLECAGDIEECLVEYISEYNQDSKQIKYISTKYRPLRRCCFWSYEANDDNILAAAERTGMGG
jgi:hypothetical protein